MARGFRWVIGRISEGSDYAGSPEYKAPTGWIWNANQADDWPEDAADEVDAEAKRLTKATGRHCCRVVKLDPLPLEVRPERDSRTRF